MTAERRPKYPGHRRFASLGLAAALAATAALVATAAGGTAEGGSPPFEPLGAGSSPVNTTALQVAAIGAPQRIHGTDRREHIDYDLVITDSFTADATLTSLVVRGGGQRLLKLQGDALAHYTRQVAGAGDPTRTTPASSAVTTYVDVVLPRSAGRTVPKRLHNRIKYTLPSGAPAEAIIGSKTVRAPDLRVDRRAPIEIEPPLRGTGWFSANACCDPDFNHRSTVLSANGTYVAPEVFAVDYIRVVDGRIFTGDGSENADWFAEGAPIRAATGGKVVSVIDDRPEVPPGESVQGNPTVTKPRDFGGNSVAVKVEPGVFAYYAHMQPGSVRVDVGERVRTGQKIGLLGNSGNTSGPHLHFGINDRRNPLTANSLPFEIDHFRFEGTAGPGPTQGEVTVTGKPHRARAEHPLLNSVSDYPG